MQLAMKILVFVFVAAWLLAPASFVLAQSSAYSAGDLIKTRDSSTVYYFGYDGKRHAFSNEPIYFSWYSNFEGIKIVTLGELADISLGRSVVVRPGTNLVKLMTDPKVYAVEPYGVLRHVTSEALARVLFGENWASKVIDLNDAFFPDYPVGQPITYQFHTEGIVFRYNNEGDKTYILKNGKAWAFKDMVKAEKHRYQERFIVYLTKPSFNYPLGYREIDEIHPLLIDTAQTLRSDELFGEAATTYTPPPSSATPSTVGTGLMGYYYSDMNFGKLMATRVDPMINFAWDRGNPASSMPYDYFSVRWLGKIWVDTSGDRNFYTWTDDGVRLYIDGNLIINNWTDHMVMWDKGQIYLTAGYHDVRLEFYEKTNGAFMKLYWVDKYTLVPTDKLYPETTQYYQSY